MISLSGTGWLLGPLLGYLLGSIPFGLLIGMSRGVDVRNQGSGNIGSTNVGRVLGRQWGYLCFILDVVKGLGPVLLAGRYLQGAENWSGDGVLTVGGQFVWWQKKILCRDEMELKTRGSICHGEGMNQDNAPRLV